MDIREFLKKFEGKYITLLFIPVGESTTSTIDGFLEEVAEDYIKLKTPDGRVAYLFNIVAYGIELYEG